METVQHELDSNPLYYNKVNTHTHTPVGLEGDLVIASNLTQVLLELFKEEAVTQRLLLGHEGMDLGEVGEAARHHLGGTVELHGAGALGDTRNSWRYWEECVWRKIHCEDPVASGDYRAWTVFL